MRFFNKVLYRLERGGFRVTFRRYSMVIQSVSDNFKVEYEVSEHPYGYLYASLLNGHEDNIWGYAHLVYYLSYTLTTEQQLVDDIEACLRSYAERVESKQEDMPYDVSEQAIIEDLQELERYKDMSRAERRRRSKEADKKLRKMARDLQEKKVGNNKDKHYGD